MERWIITGRMVGIYSLRTSWPTTAGSDSRNNNLSSAERLRWKNSASCDYAEERRWWWTCGKRGEQQTIRQLIWLESRSIMLSFQVFTSSSPTTQQRWNQSFLSKKCKQILDRLLFFRSLVRNPPNRVHERGQKFWYFWRTPMYALLRRTQSLQ